VPFRQHPDRYRVALKVALQVCGVKSERQAAMLTILFSEACREAPPWNDIAAPPSVHKAIGFEKIVRPGAPVTIEGRARTIRKKWELNAEDQKWLFYMTNALCLCLNSAMHPYATKLMVRSLASTVGETLFAEKTLFPMIDGRAPDSPQ
jgi:hypothetical protein